MKGKDINNIVPGRYPTFDKKTYKSGVWGSIIRNFLNGGSKWSIDPKSMKSIDNRMQRISSGWMDLKFLGEVTTLRFGPQEDALEVVMGVKMSRSILHVLANTLEKGSYSVDKKGYLIIPKQSDQQKLIDALNRAFGVQIRLLREVECDALEEVFGSLTLMKKVKAYWTAVVDILRSYTNLPFTRREGECSEARLVVCRLSKTLKLTVAYPQIKPKEEDKEAKRYVYTELDMGRKAVKVEPKPAGITIPRIFYKK